MQEAVGAYKVEISDEAIYEFLEENYRHQWNAGDSKIRASTKTFEFSSSFYTC
jgi:hypothetical protein